MSFLYPTRLIGLCSSLTMGFGHAELKRDKGLFICREHDVQLVVPEKSLARGSVQIQLPGPCEQFPQWTPQDYADAQGLIDKVVRVWKSQGITDYMIYGKDAISTIDPFCWEVVPYPKTEWRICRIWKQIKVLWNLTFGGISTPLAERKKIVTTIQNESEQSPQSQDGQILAQTAARVESVQKVVHHTDPFCTLQVIQKQCVFESKEIYVLYNYAPIALGKDKLHFLLVPKAHRETFKDVTGAEYMKIMQLTQELIKHYNKQGLHTAYIFDKSGAEAGQTVPHWHEHLVFTATPTQEFLGRLKVLKNMIFGSSPLPARELKDRVTHLKQTLPEILSSSYE